MIEEKGEGIVLKSIDYKESSRILSLFTLQTGIISLIVKHVSKKKPILINLTTPLCQGEFIYRRNRSSLFSFIDGTILDLHLPLRSSYLRLQIAGKMLNIVSTTQFPEKPASALYQLLLVYLKKLQTFLEPETLYASFQLKLLKHEGLLSIAHSCNRCQKRSASTLVKRESLCPNCAPPGTPSFSETEWNVLLKLFHSRSFDALLPLKLSHSLQKGIALCCQTS